jgi:hypothetical protein
LSPSASNPPISPPPISPSSTNPISHLLTHLMILQIIHQIPHLHQCQIYLPQLSTQITPPSPLVLNPLPHTQIPLFDKVLG